MEYNQETWNDIPNFKGLYQITPKGEVRSVKRKIGNRTYGGKILKQVKDNKYFVVSLSKGNQKKNYAVHRLVAITYIPNPNNFPVVNHKDENPSNNCVDNLEWCTNEYNLQYGTSIERRAQTHTGMKHRFGAHILQRKPIVATSTNSGVALSFESLTMAEQCLGISTATISFACKTGKIKGGYKFEYQK